MNIRTIFKTLGLLLLTEAALLLLPLIVSLIYQDGCYLSFIIPIGALLLTGGLLQLIKPKRKDFFAAEGFTVVGLSWIALSAFGALPFVISGQIPSYVDAFFETVSGFTTTGASILTDVEALSKSIIFWRSFTHWIGGMGILVFILAILPNSEGQNIFILRAESTGPQVGKLVSKVRFTARILYVIYFGLTILEMVFLLAGGMPLFDSICISFGTAGTGGFGILNTSMGSYNAFCQVTVGVFMVIFGINFNIFYLMLIGRVKQALESEELRWYLGIVLLSTIAIAINIIIELDTNIWVAIKDSFFQVASVITTTGFSTLDYEVWPTLSKIILFVLMFIGACAGSTGGGIKVSRIIILFKSGRRNVHKLLHPNSVSQVTFEGTPISEEVVNNVVNYFGIFMVIFAVCLIVVSFDGKDITTTITAVTACINNIGPGFGEVGPAGNFSKFSDVSKITLSIAMLIGRLEIYPILVCISPRAWRNR